MDGKLEDESSQHLTLDHSLVVLLRKGILYLAFVVLLAFRSLSLVLVLQEVLEVAGRSHLGKRTDHRSLYVHDLHLFLLLVR